MDIVLVAAVAENGIIGRDNGLPWRLKSDMVHFRALTMDKPVVMGRKSYQSIGKPLKGRTTIVVTRDAGFAAPGVVVASSIDAALTVARGDALRRGADAIMIAGGAEIYASTIDHATRLAITLVHVRAEGDVRFPSISAKLWHETARSERTPGPDDQAAFTFVNYERTVDHDRPLSAPDSGQD
jgi:dihydrofolate reductase